MRSVNLPVPSRCHDSFSVAQITAQVFICNDHITEGEGEEALVVLGLERKQNFHIRTTGERIERVHPSPAKETSSQELDGKVTSTYQ